MKTRMTFRRFMSGEILLENVDVDQLTPIGDVIRFIQVKGNVVIVTIDKGASVGYSEGFATIGIRRG